MFNKGAWFIINIEDIKKRDIKVKKRDKRIVDFDINRISKAISGANNDLQYGESNPEIPSNNIDGLVINVVKKINEVECKATTKENSDGETETSSEVSTPVEDVKISSIIVETNGVDYGKPDTIEPFNT